MVASVLIVVAGLAAYAGSFSGPFVFDDPSSITENPTIRQLWPPWDVLATPRANVTAQGRPVLNLSFAVNYAISKSDVWSYHALNVFIHILAGLTLYEIVRRTLVNGGIWLAGTRGLSVTRGAMVAAPEAAASRTAMAMAIGLVVALLWTLHPLQTESVTYIVQRAESLMGLFYLLTLYGFVRYAEAGLSRPPAKWALWSIVACGLGMATKEVMVSAPVMVLLYDRAFVAGSFREAWQKRRAFYGGLAAGWIILGLCLLRGGGTRGGSLGLGVGGSWWDYASTQFEAIGRYLLLSFWPHPLVFEYGAFKVQHTSEVLPWAVIVVPAVVGTLWALWRRPVFGFLGGWFFAMLAPTSLVPGTSQMIVEHRMYLSLAAVLVLAVWVGYPLTVHLGIGNIGQTPAAGRQARGLSPYEVGGARRRSAAALLVFALPIAAGFGWLTFERNAVYRSGLGLWSDTVAKRPNNPMAHYMLAEELLALRRFEEARRHLEEATRLHRRFSLAHERLGELLVRQGEPVKAAVHFEEALRQKPDFADAHANFGNLLAKQGRTDEAIAHLERAVAITPEFAEAHLDLANLILQSGRAAEAIVHFQQVLRLQPDFPAVEYNLANTFAALQRHEEAIAHYGKALRLKPDYPTAAFNLANSFAALRRFEEAIIHYREALRLKSDYAAAELNLGSVFFELGRFAEAEAHYLAALRLDPNSEETRGQLARVRAIKGR